MCRNASPLWAAPAVDDPEMTPDCAVAMPPDAVEILLFLRVCPTGTSCPK